MNNLDLKEIVFITIDEWSNFENVRKNNALSDIFLESLCFNNHKDFLEYINNEENINVKFTLCIHVFRNENNKGYKENPAKIIIPQEYPEIDIIFVTSDSEENVATEIKQTGKVYRYDQFIEAVSKGNISTYLVSNLLKKDTKEKNLIFISHSSKDKETATLFVEKLLKLGLGVPKEDIFYTSDYATSIKLGEDIPDALKKALETMTLFISIISEDYFKSTVCLNEMGAGWGLLDKEKNIQLLLPDVEIKEDEMGFINVQKLGVRLNDKINLYKIFDDYQSIFSRYKPKSGVFSEQLNKYIKEIQKL